MLREKIQATFRRFQSAKKRGKIPHKNVTIRLSSEARSNIVRSIRQHQA